MITAPPYVQGADLPRACMVNGCDKQHSANGYCAMHNTRIWRTGTAELSRVERDGCSIDGCDAPHKARGYCQKHYWRLKRRGSPNVSLKPGRLKGSFVWTDEPSYTSAHERIYSLRGPASEQACAECGADAQDWAYDHSDPAELYGGPGTKRPYSANPQRYRALCRRCHRRTDKAAA